MSAVRPLPRPDSSPERDLIVEAMLDLVCERGYEDATVEMVTARADLDRTAFELYFTDFDDCYMQLFEQFTEEFDRCVFGGYETEGSWRDRLRAAGYGALRYVRDHPRESAFSSTQMFAAGEVPQAYRERHLRRLAGLIDTGRQELDDPDSMTKGVAEGVLGSIYVTVTKILNDGSGVDSIEKIVPTMMYLAVRPYLGLEAAREELTIPPPPEQGDLDG